MLNIHLIHEARTEHAKAVRRLTGTNDFRDKEWHLRQGCVMQCIGTFLTTEESDCNMLRLIVQIINKKKYESLRRKNNSQRPRTQ